MGTPGSEKLYPHTGVIVSVSQSSTYEVDTGTDGTCAMTRGEKGLLTVDENGATTRAGVFAGGDAVAGARTVVEAVKELLKEMHSWMDAYMKSLPKDETPDPYANIPVFDSPTPDVFGEQKV